MTSEQAEKLGSDVAMAIPETKCLYLEHTNGISTVWKAHQKMMDYMEQNHLALSGTVYEEYRMDRSVGIYYEEME